MVNFWYFYDSSTEKVEFYILLIFNDLLYEKETQ